MFTAWKISDLSSFRRDNDASLAKLERLAGVRNDDLNQYFAQYLAAIITVACETWYTNTGSVLATVVEGIAQTAIRDGRPTEFRNGGNHAL